jgi:hypothetical protein
MCSFDRNRQGTMCSFGRNTMCSFGRNTMCSFGRNTMCSLPKVRTLTDSFGRNLKIPYTRVSPSSRHSSLAPLTLSPTMIIRPFSLLSLMTRQHAFAWMRFSVFRCSALLATTTRNATSGFTLFLALCRRCHFVYNMRVFVDCLPSPLTN